MIRPLVALTALAFCQAAVAQSPPPVRQLRPKDPVTIEANRAYILFRARRLMGFRFLHVPADAGMTPAGAAADRVNWIDVNGWMTVEKGGPIGTFLVPVEPGTYYLYGEKTNWHLGGLEYSLMCLCMGTLRFEAKAGMITDLGEIRQLFTETNKGRKPDSLGRTITFEGNREIRSMAVTLPAASDYVPPRLAAFKREPAFYQAAGMLPNVSGVGIDRISAIPGIITYDRDKVIDARTGQQVR